MRRVLVLGSTGSIGSQALQVIGASEGLRVVGLSCHKNAGLLVEQAASSGCRELAITDEAAAGRIEGSLPTGTVLRRGADSAARLVREVDADIVLNAIVGFAGLRSTLAALETGRTLALANKESLVCAGSMVTELSAKRRAPVLPVDSEHSALYQLVAAARREAVVSVVITGSGGPFRGRDRVYLSTVTKAQALAHPTWNMGEKISIDSATLMNKGLEVIEAHHLFGLPYERIEVVLHPQSIVHSLVRLVDGALLAHLGMPDMRVPIAFALHYPERVGVPVSPLELTSGLSLEFSAPDEETFPALRLAREAGGRGDACTCALNAANEVAVAAFLGGTLAFTSISSVVEEVLRDSESGTLGTFEEAEEVDAWARRVAAQACARQSTERSKGSGL